MTRIDPRIAARRKAVQESHARRSLGRLFVLLTVLAVVAAVAWAFRSPLLSVATIETEGITRVDAAGLLAEVGVRAGTPLMDVDVEAAAARLEQDPWIEAATVVRAWPTGLVVTATERVPVGWVRTSDGWAWVASDGVVVGTASEPEPGVPTLVLPDRPASALAADPGVVGMLEFMGALPPALAETAVIRAVGTGFEAVIGGYAVRLGSGEEGLAKAAALAAVIERTPEQGSVITVIAPGQPAILPPSAVVDPAAGGEVVDDNPEGD